MKLFRLFNSSYRKHKWAAKHLAEYRDKPAWLFMRRRKRFFAMARKGFASDGLIMAQLVDRKFTLPREGTIHIPKIRGIERGK